MRSILLLTLCLASVQCSSEPKLAEQVPQHAHYLWFEQIDAYHSIGKLRVDDQCFLWFTQRYAESYVSIAASPVVC